MSAYNPDEKPSAKTMHAAVSKILEESGSPFFLVIFRDDEMKADASSNLDEYAGQMDEHFRVAVAAALESMLGKKP